MLLPVSHFKKNPFHGFFMGGCGVTSAVHHGRMCSFCRLDCVEKPTLVP